MDTNKKLININIRTRWVFHLSGNI